ncbi:rhodanese-like domain-containing protein [Nitratifractor sp.]
MCRLKISLVAAAVFVHILHAGNAPIVEYTDADGKKQKIVIERKSDSVCKNIKVSPRIWDDDYVERKIDKRCKKTFVTTIGKISPIKMEGIETVGELEVIEFMKKMRSSDRYMLIDTRFENWYYAKTIPSSVNIPFNLFNKKKFPGEFEDTMEELGVKMLQNGKYDFSKARTILLFCNGPWCLQSPTAIKNLLHMGYPKEKILWYRGGIQSWMMLGLPTVVQE